MVFSEHQYQRIVAAADEMGIPVLLAQSLIITLGRAQVLPMDNDTLGEAFVLDYAKTLSMLMKVLPNKSSKEMSDQDYALLAQEPGFGGLLSSVSGTDPITYTDYKALKKARTDFELAIDRLGYRLLSTIALMFKDEISNVAKLYKS